MTSVQDFEVNLRACAGDVDAGTLKDVVSTVKEVVENCDCKMAMIIIKSKLNKKHGGEIYINVAECGRYMFYRIGGIKGVNAVLVDGKWCRVEKGVDIENLSLVEKWRLPLYTDGIVLVGVKVVESFNLLSLALREVMKMVKDRESVRTLEIPDEVKDIMMKYWSSSISKRYCENN